MRLSNCENRTHVSRGWIRRLAGKHGNGPVMEYAKGFSGNSYLGIGALRWWWNYGYGPGQKTEINMISEKLIEFEMNRRPLQIECDGCEKKEGCK